MYCVLYRRFHCIIVYYTQLFFVCVCDSDHLISIKPILCVSLFNNNEIVVNLIYPHLQVYSIIHIEFKRYDFEFHLDLNFSFLSHNITHACIYMDIKFAIRVYDLIVIFTIQVL